MNRSDFHVGQTVYINDFSRGEKQGGLRAEKIAKIGTRWIETNSGCDERFSIETSLNYYGYSKKLYINPSDYYDRVDSTEICKAIIKSLQHNKKAIRQLKAAAEILNVEYEPCERTFEIKKEHKNDS